MSMHKLILLSLTVALSLSCKAMPEKAIAEPQPIQSGVNQSEATNSQTQSPQPGDPLSPFEKDGSVKSSFPPGVVVRLNAIVARSKAAIDRFDKVLPELQTAVDAVKAKPSNATALDKAKTGISELDALQKEAAAAKADLAAEGEQLVKSGQYYDQAIFSGMARFVSRVDKEIANEKNAMSASLPK